MRKTLSIILAFLLIISVFGCSKKSNNTPPPLPMAFESDLQVILSERRLSAHIKNTALNSFVIEVTEPEAVAGMKITYDGKNGKIDYKGLSFDLNTDRFPESAFSSSLAEALNQLAISDSLKIEEDKSDWRYTGEIPMGGFLIVQDGKTGFLKYISVPSIDLSAEFSNFVELK